MSMELEEKLKIKQNRKKTSSRGLIVICAIALIVVCGQIPFENGTEKTGLAIGLALSTLLLVTSGVLRLELAVFLLKKHFIKQFPGK